MCLNTNSDRPSKIFLERSGPRAINSEGLKPPKPDCDVCSAVQGGLSVGPSATLKDLVEGVLQGELGYNTGEMSIRTGQSVIYETEMEDNLAAAREVLRFSNGTCWLWTADLDPSAHVDSCKVKEDDALCTAVQEILGPWHNYCFPSPGDGWDVVLKKPVAAGL